MSLKSHAQLVAVPTPRPALLQRLLPVAGWLPHYRGGRLTGDVLAALTVWALLVPEALAYAGIVGVPPQYGLYAAPLALVAYAVFGGSRHLVVGPSSTVAIVSAAVVAPLAAGASDERYLALTVALALLTGALLVGAGLARLGFVAKFLARPVLDGFIMGLALTIVVGQAGKLVGVHLSGETALDKTVSILSQIGDWTVLPIVVGGASLAVLFGLERCVPKVPAAIVATVLATAATYALGLADRGLSIVGDIPGGLPGWALGGIGARDLYALLPGACAVALVGFTESIAVAKDDATRHDYEVDANQEMVANGVANLGAGIFQGFVVDGSLSKSAAGESAGGRTQVMSLVCAALTLATILFLTGLFTYLPEATLGAIVIVALRKYFSASWLVRLLRVRRNDFALAAAALAGVLVFGVVPGVVIGVVLSLALLISRQSSPNSVVLGRDPHGGGFADVVTHPGYELVPGLLIYRFDGPLIFPNAERFVHEVRTLVKGGVVAPGVRDAGVGVAPPGGGSGSATAGGAAASAGAEDAAAGDAMTGGAMSSGAAADGDERGSQTAAQAIRAVIVDFETTADMDTTAADHIADLFTSLREAGVRVMLARVHTTVRDFMEKDGIIERLGAGDIFTRVEDAVASFECGEPADRRRTRAGSDDEAPG